MLPGLLFVAWSWPLFTTALASTGPLANIERLQQEIQRLGHEEQTLRERIKELDRTLLQAETQLAGQQQTESTLLKRLRNRILVLDRLGRAGRLGLLLDADSLRDLHRREMLLRRTFRTEHHLLSEAARVHRTMRQARDEAASVRRDVVQAQQELQRTQEVLIRQVESRTALLNRMYRETELAQAGAAEMDASALALRQLLDRLTREQPRAVSLEGRRGQLQPPIAGRLLLNFGVRRNPRLKTEIRHLGVDYFAPVGTAVVAVHPGVVAHAGPLLGFGVVVILAHGHGYHTVYAQLQQPLVKVGSTVDAGMQLGEVGPDLLDEPPHLHFEVRNRGRAEDPSLWLEQQQGRP